ncbi:MAG: AraC family transcriptional regulator [Paenibacillaceae bacterium]|jgi:AraC-like DNA-binding protein|nr:MAG: AraC family transcriptional regulator [Paenibacillaceae bacterium]
MTEIFYVECDATHPDSFVFDIPNGHDCWLLVFTKTPAVFWVENRLREYPAYSAILYRPHQKIYYRACADQYINNWLRFASDESYVSDAPLPFGVPFSVKDPEYCHQLFQLLVCEHSFTNTFKQSSVNYLLRILFNKLLESYESHFSEEVTPQYYNLLKLRTAIYSNPGRNWTVPKMAEMVHISPGYLQVVYKKTFGVSPMSDVINSRIRSAKEYLMHSSYSVAEIADRCGYLHVEHFCRQFKQVTGFSPREYHRRFRSRTEA